MIASGEKKEEYRDITPYWETRLEGKEYDTVTFYLGYARDRYQMTYEVLYIEKGNANPDWSSGELTKRYYKIGLGKCINKNF